jgi:hypothetical protein
MYNFFKTLLVHMRNIYTMSPCTQLVLLSFFSFKKKQRRVVSTESLMTFRKLLKASTLVYPIWLPNLLKAHEVSKKTLAASTNTNEPYRF